MSFQVCPFHTDEEVRGAAMADGSEAFVCARIEGHPLYGEFTWITAPQTGDPAANKSASSSGQSLMAQYRLLEELPGAVADLTEALGQRWFEYGLMERAYAQRCPEDFAALVERFGHSATRNRKHTVSAYLARIGSEVARRGLLALRTAPGTGRWAYNDPISWWALPTGAPWAHRSSWVEIFGGSPADAGTPADACLSYLHA